MFVWKWQTNYPKKYLRKSKKSVDFSNAGWYDIKVVTWWQGAHWKLNKDTPRMWGSSRKLDEQPTIRQQTSWVKNKLVKKWVNKTYENFSWEFDPGSGRTLAACLIHASRTHWRRTCSLDVSGARVSNTWETYPSAGDNHRKRWLIPHRRQNRLVQSGKTASAVTEGWSRAALASW